MFLAIAPLLAAQPQWKDRREIETTWSTDPAERLKQLDSWSKQYPDTQFAMNRRLAYLSVYLQLKQAPEAFRVANEILAADPSNLQALTSLCVLVLKYEAPPREHLDAASRAAERILQNLDTYFGDDKRPLGATVSQWNQSKAEVRDYADRARDIATKPQQDQSADVAPDVLVWRDIKRALLGPEGNEYFESGVKGALLPSGIEKNGIKLRAFYAKILSIESPLVLIGRIEGDQPELRLEITGEPEAGLRPGMLCGFSGVAHDFRKDPFQFTFRVEPKDLDCH